MPHVHRFSLDGTKFAPRRPWQAYDLIILCLELSQLRRSVGLGCEVAFKFQPLLRSEGAKDVGDVPFREVDKPLSSNAIGNARIG